MPDGEADWTALFRAANGGDRVAYARFLQEITPVLRGIIRVRGRSVPAHQHEDILQEALLAIHAKRHTWDPARPLRPWLYAIVRHKVTDAFRARGARVELDLADFIEILAAEPGPDPTAAGDARRLMDQLEPRAAEIVRAIGLDGETPGAAAERLQMTEGAIRVALHRAMKRLSLLAHGTLR